MSADKNIQPDLLAKGYALYTSGEYLKSALLLLFRFSIGWKIYLSGYRHLHDIETMVGRFTKWDVPFPRLSVYVSGSTELVCGALLMLGLATRLVSIPLVFNFLVAILTAGSLKVKQAIMGGSYLSPDDYDPGRLSGLEAIIDDTAFPFLLTALLTFTFGAGKVSLDYLIYRLWFQKRTDVQGNASVSVSRPQNRPPTDT